MKVAVVLTVGAMALACSRASVAASSQNVADATVPCGALYQPFLGTWSGRFWAYVRAESTSSKTVYRPYDETVIYTNDGCRRNTQTGDTFVVGNETDRYPAFGRLPAKTSHGLLITGRRADGTPFLRTADDQGTHDYSLVYRNEAAKLAIWQLRIPASAQSPEMDFTTIDAQDFKAAGGDTRDVTVTLTVGTPSSPYWQGVIAYGSHSKR